ncbi:unnamed protein product [Malus baccata var. baccata]
MSRRSAFFPYSCFRFEVTAFEGSILSFSHSWVRLVNPHLEVHIFFEKVKDLLPEEYASQKLKLSESPSLRASGANACQKGGRWLYPRLSIRV